MTVDECLGTDILVAIVDGQASPEVRDRVERHASRCATCRDLLSSLARPTDDSAPTAPILERIGRYIVSGYLGAGGMGVVYEAFDPELGRTLAIKVLHERLDSARMQARLRREAQAMAQLTHPNVVTVFDVGSYQGHIFIAMEYVKGKTLATWQRDQSPAAILGAYLDAARGLAAAHAAGIVHRDFKPDNVLIGEDGRVRVADFGLASAAGETLARMTTDLSPVSPVAPTLPGGELTQAGAIVGTPYFIAPEVYEGGDADARSDQYSFARALSQALGAGASRRCRRALAKGLAACPDDRFATMAELIASVTPRRGSRPLWIGVFAGAAIAATLLVVLSGHRAELCARAGEGLGDVWNPVRRITLDTTILGTRVPYANATRRELGRTFDQFTADWSTMRVAACRATHERGEQSAELLDRRMQCLDERRRAFAQLLDSISTAKPETIARAVGAATELPSIADCGDMAVLADRVRAPSPAIKLQVAALGGDLAAVGARQAAGEYAPALATARGLLDRASLLRYRPIEARAALTVGRVERALEHYPEARIADERAVLASEVGGDDRIRAEALVELAMVVGSGLGLHAEADALRARADAAVERLGRPATLQIAYLETAGQLAFVAGKLDDSQRALTTALALAEQVYGRDDLRLVGQLHRLAKLDLERSNPIGARGLLERAQRIQERVLEADHPELAETTAMLAGVAYEQADYDRAEHMYERAIAIYERAFGQDSLAVARTLSNLGNVYQWQGKPAAAVGVARRAIAIATSRLGKDHALVLSFRESLASALEDLDHDTEAHAELESIVTQQRALLGDHQDTATTLQMLAHVEVELGQYAAARDHAKEALAMMERVLGVDYHPTDELLVLGRAYLGLHDATAAVNVFERARAEIQPGNDPSSTAWIGVELGRALVDSGRDPARGLALVRAGRATLLADPDRAGRNLEELAVWTKAHHVD